MSTKKPEIFIVWGVIPHESPRLIKVFSQLDTAVKFMNRCVNYSNTWRGPFYFEEKEGSIETSSDEARAAFYKRLDVFAKSHPAGEADSECKAFVVMEYKVH